MIDEMMNEDERGARTKNWDLITFPLSNGDLTTTTSNFCF
jgi:hypothetical protein